MEPPTKKAKTEETPAEVETAEAPELEADAPADKTVKLKVAPVFNVEDTTLNVMASTNGNTLMPLTDGGLQYLFAGAKANVGLKSGRYMFEVKVLETMAPLEDPTARQRVSQPRSQVRIGFATAKSALFLGETADSVCFDSEGHLIYDKKKSQVSQKFTTGDVIAVVLNLDASSANANTISLFKDGVRVSPPQPLPDSLQVEPIFPMITFKNATLHYNFGPVPITPLPFTCRMVSDAAQKDTVVKAAVKQNAKNEVIFPVALPDQGGFDWLDKFLDAHPHYTELSDRAILKWCELSGIFRPKGYSAQARTSNDKPEMGFGIVALDDLSVKKVLQTVAPMFKRDYVVMEMRSSLLKDERKDLTTPWAGFNKVAVVAVGEPPAAIKEYGHEIMLKTKQETLDAEYKTKFAQEKQKWQLQKQHKKMEFEKKKAMKKQQKLQEGMKKKLEYDRKKKEAEAKGETFLEEEPKDDDAVEEEEEFEEDPEPMEEDAPTAELTEEEKKLWFRKAPASDLTPYLLNTSYQKFSLPEKSEGFEEVRYEWQSDAKSKQYFKEWVQNMKLTSRIEDLQPSEWFLGKWKEWQKVLQSWHTKQTQYKAAVTKKLADAVAKEAKRKAREAAKEAAEKEGKDAPMEELEEEVEEEEDKADFDNLDVFGVEDILNIGAGEPLFSAFAFEDWSMLSLRFELHLLVHAFRRDVNDPDRTSIHLEHLPFYYNKYYKKAFNSKFFGFDTYEEVLQLVRDTVLLNPKRKVLEALLPEELEANNVFVMLTEESRRERNRRVDMGDESAKLKVSLPGPSILPGAGLGAVVPGIRPALQPVAPGLTAMARPVAQVTPGLVTPQVQQQNWWNQQGKGAAPFAAGFRPPMFGQVRPFQAQAWRGW